MAASTPAWKVTAQTETTDRGPDGRAARGMSVQFVTAKGVHASVFVPLNQYDPASVSTLVGERAKLIDSVHGLSG